MARPTSFRLSEDLLEQLDEAAGNSGTSVSALVTTILLEGLKTRRFPGVVYRDGPAGRRAALANGPDIWEIVRDLPHCEGRGEQRVRSLADSINLPLDRVRLAIDFYTAFPTEIDARIEADEREAERVREMIDRRERLLSS